MKSTSVWLTAGNCSPPANRHWLSWQTAKTLICKASCTAKQLVSELAGMDGKLSGILDMLEEATIQLSEASDELRHYCDRLDLDPNRLFELEQRISKQISLARKHHVALKRCHSSISHCWMNNSS